MTGQDHPKVHRAGKPVKIVQTDGLLAGVPVLDGAPITLADVFPSDKLNSPDA